MSWLKESLGDHPELAVFLAVGLGALLGRIPLGRHARLGLIPGTLLVGVALGDLADLTVPPALANAFFILFLFAIGYKVGPQFFHGLRSDGLRQAAVAVVIAVTGLATTWVVAKVLGFEAGEAAGLLSGGLTQSAAVATATDAIGRLDTSEAARTDLAGFVAVGYAVCYPFGAAGAAWWTATVLPRLLRVDLAAEAAALDAELGGSRADGVAPAYPLIVHRAYRITAPHLAGQRLADVEHRAADRGHRVFALALRRGTQIHDPDPALVLEVGDVVAISSRLDAVVAERLQALGEEVDDPELLAYEVETVGAVVTHKGMAGRTIGDLRRATLERGVFIGQIERAGIPIPLIDETVVRSGDELHLTGPRTAVEATASQIGFVEHPTPESDILLVSMGIVIGGLVGLPSIDAANTTLRLTTSVGALLAGLTFGWLRSRRPTFGRVPPAAQWVFETFALALAIAVIGINAGPNFVEGIRESGLALILGGVVVTLVPLTVGAFMASKLLRLSSPFALGATAGGMTSTPTLAAVNEAAGTTAATLGYTVPYALANVLLTLSGAAIVLLLT